MGKADFGAKGATPAVPLMSDLGPLPDAERQVRSIAAVYGPERSATYLGAEAREDRFKAEAPRHAVLHLATHGVLDETSPLYSHVVLSPGAGGSSEDGLLEAWEMLDLRLDADLVVLSACETGRGRIAPGEGIVGTMWALFVAGIAGPPGQPVEGRVGEHDGADDGVPSRAGTRRGRRPRISGARQPRGPAPPALRASVLLGGLRPRRQPVLSDLRPVAPRRAAVRTSGSPCDPR